MACHRFVSHVTGFATFFGYEINQALGWKALSMLVVPLCFLLGAMVSGELVDLRLKLKLNPKYYITFGIIFFLLFLITVSGIRGAFGIFGEPFELSRDYVLLAILCFVCGIQNGTTTTVSNSVVRTTHLTGLTTDLGIGIVRMLNGKRLGEKLQDEQRANTMRVGIIASFVFGSIVGGYVFGNFGYYGFVLPTLTSGLLFVLMMYFQWNRKSQSESKEKI